MDKGVELFNDLSKVPDSAIIKSQQIEIGKLKAYIDELEFNKPPSESKIINYNMQINNMEKALINRKSEIKNLKSKIKKQEEEINSLMYKNFHSIKV